MPPRTPKDFEDELDGGGGLFSFAVSAYMPPQRGCRDT